MINSLWVRLFCWGSGLVCKPCIRYYPGVVSCIVHVPILHDTSTNAILNIQRVQADTTYISTRVLGHFGYMIDSMISLHHANTVVVVPALPEACTANMRRSRKTNIFAKRCRKYCACDTGRSNLRVHVDALYLFKYWVVLATR